MQMNKLGSYMALLAMGKKTSMPQFYMNQK